MKSRLIAVLAGVVCAALCYSFGPRDVVYDECFSQLYEVADCEDFPKAEGAGKARNVIVIIADGMGVNHVYSSRAYLRGADSPFAWEELPHSGLVTTCAVGQITDSAASATAYSTGHKTRNAVVSMTPLPVMVDVPNMADIIDGRKAIGVVSNTKVWDATPAAFIAHSEDRGRDRAIARDIVRKTSPELVLGGGRHAFEALPQGERMLTLMRDDQLKYAENAGYTVVGTREELAATDPDTTDRMLGLFAPGAHQFMAERAEDTTEPVLSEMTAFALDMLEEDERGFFLVIEGARIDHASHGTNFDEMIAEMEEFDRAISLVLGWARDRDDTLILITADHETGDLVVKPGDYKKGERVEFKWQGEYKPGRTRHSSQRVPVYAVGPNAGAVDDHMDNTEIHCVIRNALDIDSGKSPVLGGARD